MGIDITQWRIEIAKYWKYASRRRHSRGKSQGVKTASATSCNSLLALLLSFSLITAPSLLLAAGDVERNPGPPKLLNVESKLSIDDLGTVLQAVFTAHTKSYKIGLILQVPVHELESIAAKFSDPGDKLLETLKVWLNTATKPTWQAILDALRSPIVGEPSLATIVEAKCCTAVEPGQVIKRAVEQPQESTIQLTKVNLTLIQGKFAKLLQLVRTKLQKDPEINKKDFLFFLDSVNLTVNCLTRSSDCEDIFEAITKNKLWTYWDYHLLEQTIERFWERDRELKVWMDEYKKDLSGYITVTKLNDHIIAALRQDTENTTTSDSDNSGTNYDRKFFRKLSIKLDRPFGDYTLKYLCTLWKSLQHLLRLPPMTLLLDTIQEGCICVTWLIPTHLAPQATETARQSVTFFEGYIYPILRVTINDELVYDLEAHVLAKETSQRASMRTSIMGGSLKTGAGTRNGTGTETGTGTGTGTGTETGRKRSHLPMNMASFRPPSPRAFHIAFHCTFESRECLFVWGGLPEKSKPGLNILNTNEEKWGPEQKLSGSHPIGLVAGAYSLLDYSLYYFGGRKSLVSHSHCTNNIYKLDLKTKKWEEIKPEESTRIPKEKSGSGMVAYGNDKLVVFAGLEKGKILTNKVDIFNIKERTWSHQETSGTEPPPCDDFTFNKISSTRVILYGGLLDTTSEVPLPLLQDPYILNLTDWCWNKLETSGVDKPVARAGHASCVGDVTIDGQLHPLLITMGGTDSSQKDLKEMWILDINNRTWNEVTLSPKTQKHINWGCSITFISSGPSSFQVMMFGGCIYGEKPTYEGTTTLITVVMKGGIWTPTQEIMDNELGEPERLTTEKLRARSAETKVDVLQRDITTAEETITRLEEDLQVKAKEAEESTENVRTLQIQLEEEKQKAVEEISKKEEVIQSLAAEAKKTFQETSETVTTLQKKIQEEQTAKENANNERDAFLDGSAIDEWKAKAQEAEESSKIAEKEAKELEKQVISLENDLEKALGRAEELSAAQIEAKERKVEVEKALDAMRKDTATTTEDAKKAVKEAERQVQTQKEALRKSQKMSMTHRDTATQIKERLEEESKAKLQAESKVCSLETELKDAKDAAEELKNRANSSDVMVQNVLSTLTEALKAKEEATQKAQELQEMTATENEKVKKLQEHIRESSQRMTENDKIARETKEKLECTIAELKEQLITKEKEITEATDGANKMLQDLTKAHEIESQFKEAQSSVQVLKERLEEAEDKAAEANRKAEQSRCEAQIATEAKLSLETAKANAEKTTAETNAQLQECEQNSQTLKEQLTQAQKERLTALRRAEELDNEKQQLEKAFRDLQDEMKERNETRTDEVENKIQAMKDTLKESEVDRQRAEKEIHSLKEKVSYLTKQSSAQQQEYEQKLEEARNEAADKQKQSATTIQELYHEQMKAERELKELQQQLSQAAEAKQTAQAEVANLQDEMDRAGKEASRKNRDLEERATEAEGILSEQKCKMIKLKETMAKLEKEHQQSNATMSETLAESQTEVQELRIKLETRKSELTEAQEALQSLRLKLNTSIEEMENGNIEIAELKEDLADLEKQHQQSNATISETLAESQTEVQELRIKLEMRKSELTKAQETAQSLRLKLNTSIEEIENGNIEIAELKADLANLEKQHQQSNATMSETLAESQTEVQELRIKLETRKGELTEAQEALQSLRLKLNTSIEEMENGNTEIAELKEDLADLEKQHQQSNATMSETLAESQTEVQELRIKLEMRKSELTKSQETAQSLRLKLNTSIEEIENGNIEIAELKADLATQEKELQGLNGRLQEAGEKLATSEAATVRVKENLKNLQEKADNSVRELERKLMEEEARNCEQIEDIKLKMASAEEAANLNIQKLQDDLQQVIISKDVKQSELENLSETLASTNKKIKELVASRDTVKETLQRIESSHKEETDRSQWAVSRLKVKAKDFQQENAAVKRHRILVIILICGILLLYNYIIMSSMSGPSDFCPADVFTFM